MGLVKEVEIGRGVRVPPRPSRTVVELEERRADARVGRRRTVRKCIFGM